MAIQSSCVCGSTPTALMMRCSEGMLFPVFRARDGLAGGLRGGLKFQGLERKFHGQITHVIELADGRFGQIIKVKVVIARFINNEVAVIYLVLTSARSAISSRSP